ncbi:MAG TPA: hypothetical protein VGR09_02920, partial [Gemmatimonadales bacterium]|nr:hypothetical protein [Gemmatimonadales bacterium]
MISLGSARLHHEGTKVTKDTKKSTRDTAKTTNNNKENNKELWVVYDRAAQSFVTFVFFVPS